MHACTCGNPRDDSTKNKVLACLRVLSDQATRSSASFLFLITNTRTNAKAFKCCQVPSSRKFQGFFLRDFPSLVEDVGRCLLPTKDLGQPPVVVLGRNFLLV